MRTECYYVYILTNFKSTVLYIGVTNNLTRRICEHYKNAGDNASFCGRYYCYWLIFYEEYNSIKVAIAREKELKSWTRKRKIALIEETNPQWKFMNKEICEYWPPPDDWE
jgi:putative endonuclease